MVRIHLLPAVGHVRNLSSACRLASLCSQRLDAVVISRCRDHTRADSELAAPLHVMDPFVTLTQRLRDQASTPVRSVARGSGIAPDQEEITRAVRENARNRTLVNLFQNQARFRRQAPRPRKTSRGCVFNGTPDRPSCRLYRCFERDPI